MNQSTAASTPETRIGECEHCGRRGVPVRATDGIDRCWPCAIVLSAHGIESAWDTEIAAATGYAGGSSGGL